MPFERPTLAELNDRAIAGINTRLPGADALLLRSNLGVLARIQSGAIHSLYGFLDFLASQLFPDTSEAEFLERQAAIFGVTRKAATAAAGTVDFTGTELSAIPLGTLLQAGDGTEIATTAAGAIAAGVAAVAVEVVAPGVAGNLAAGVSLGLVSPVAGIDATATVAAGGLTGGADGESDDSLRARLLDRIRQPPHGGAASDYEQWSLQVAGVTRVFVAPTEQGLGTVVVRFAVDDDPAGPIPDAAKVAEVQAFIDPLRPVTADVIVLAPIAVPLNFTIQLTPNTATVQAAVDAELRDLLRREAKPGATILISHIREAVSIAAGETDHVVSVPAADVAHGPGDMAVFGAITWV